MPRAPCSLRFHPLSTFDRGELAPHRSTASHRRGFRINLEASTIQTPHVSLWACHAPERASRADMRRERIEARKPLRSDEPAPSAGRSRKGNEVPFVMAKSRPETTESEGGTLKKSPIDLAVPASSSSSHSEQTALTEDVRSLTFTGTIRSGKAGWTTRLSHSGRTDTGRKVSERYLRGTEWRCRDRDGQRNRQWQTQILFEVGSTDHWHHVPVIGLYALLI